jgi:hypothetical protein
MTDVGGDPKVTACQQLADSYLDHVLIALAAGDPGANLRNFIDPWWIFARGGDLVVHRRKGGYRAREFNRPCAWRERGRLRLFDWLSPGAERICERANLLPRATVDCGSPEGPVVLPSPYGVQGLQRQASLVSCTCRRRK